MKFDLLSDSGTRLQLPSCIKKPCRTLHPRPRRTSFPFKAACLEDPSWPGLLRCRSTPQLTTLPTLPTPFLAAFPDSFSVRNPSRPPQNPASGSSAPRPLRPHPRRLRADRFGCRSTRFRWRFSRMRSSTRLFGCYLPTTTLRCVLCFLCSFVCYLCLVGEASEGLGADPSRVFRPG